MPHLHGSDDGLEQILPAGLEYRSVGLVGQGALVDLSTLLQSEEVEPHHTLEELLMLGNGLLGTLHVDHHRHGRVGRREHVVMNLGNTRIIPNLGAEVGRGHQWHVAVVAIDLRDGRIVEARDTMARDTAETIGIQMVLPTEPLVVVELLRKMDLVTGTAEILRLVQRLEEALLVELGLGLHELLVDPGQDGIVGEGEGIMLRLVDRVVGVSTGTVDVADHMADRACDAGMRRGIVHHVVVRIVERPAEEGHRVVATGAEAGGIDVTVPLKSHLPGLLDRCEVGRIVERRELVNRMHP